MSSRAEAGSEQADRHKQAQTASEMEGMRRGGGAEKERRMDIGRIIKAAL